MNKYFLIATLLAGLLLSCKKHKHDVISTSLAAQTILDVSYGSDAQQKMDVYLPAGRNSSTTKVIVLVHGGAWSSGDKSDFNSFIDTFKVRLPGYAIINLNYRLYNGISNNFPMQEMDVKSAIEFIAAKTNEYNISQKLALLGASAGGHLVLLQGYKYSSPIKIKVIVDFFGPTDLADAYNNPSPSFPATLVAFLMGGTPTTNPSAYQQSSPINFVTSQSPPTIILQGGADPLVNPSQSASLNAKLQAMGVVHQYVFYPTEGHGWVGANMVDSFDKIVAFLNANVN